MKVSGFNIIASGTRNEKKTFCVLGSARGGTSMVSGLLRLMSINMGNDLDLDNNEDQEFLKTSQPIPDLANKLSPNHNNKVNDMIRLIKNKNKQNYIWGWKDPQSYIYFHLIDKYLINPHCIIIYRDPLAIAQKEIQSGIHCDVIKTLNLVVKNRFMRLLETTNYVNEKKYPLLLISYERSLRDKENLIKTLADFLQINLSDELMNVCKSYIKADRNSGKIGSL